MTGSSYELSAVPEGARTSSVLDVALIFAGANVVTSTLVTGGTLGLMGGSFTRLALIAVLGIAAGTLPIAVLARLGPRTGLPSMVLLREPFGPAGAAAVSLLLVITNFAWIALNNVVAAQAMSVVMGGAEWAWSVIVGAAATALALGGQRLMALFDRLAVPLLAILGTLLTVELLRTPAHSITEATVAAPAVGVMLALDLVIGYQISWSLMFADYTRFQRRPGQASRSVLLGLSASSLWLLLVGIEAARRSGGNDPTSMVLGLGLPVTILVLVALSTITTNFVNLYLSALAVRNLRPKFAPTTVVIAVGAIGTALGVSSSGFLDRYADFMSTLATLLLPIVAVALVHFFGPRPWRETSRDRSRPVHAGRPATDFPKASSGWRSLRPLGVGSWLAGVVTYQVCSRTSVAMSLGATLPTLMVTAMTYALLSRHRAQRPHERRPT